MPALAPFRIALGAGDERTDKFSCCFSHPYIAIVLAQWKDNGTKLAPFRVFVSCNPICRRGSAKNPRLWFWCNFPLEGRSELPDSNGGRSSSVGFLPFFCVRWIENLMKLYSCTVMQVFGNGCCRESLERRNAVKIFQRFLFHYLYGNDHKLALEK